ncbi:MAG: hypothetical protein R3B13_38505 [Polyangiaceae bacterium]
MVPETGGSSEFKGRFSRLARAVRSRLLARQLLTGASLGLLAAAGAAAVLWWQRFPQYRWWGFGLAGIGAVLAVVFARRGRWSDSHVAMFLDAKLGSKEAISTAVELNSEEGASHVVIRDATRALDSADARRARPRVLSRLHVLGPVGAAAVTYLCLIPARPVPPPDAPPPGAEMVQLAELLGLEKIEALEKLDARDAAQEQRLKKIAEEAKKLRADLAKGMEKREAQSRIAKLRDDIASERLKLTDEKSRPGLEAAVAKLNKSPHLKDAAKALGDGDLVAFDKEMQRLANLAEEGDRKAAKEALEEAKKAAKAKGAEALAEALEQQQKKFEEREGKAEALRELAKELGDAGKLTPEQMEDLEEFGRSGDPEAGRRLAESMNKALEGLTPEERKRLAEKLRKQMEKGGKDGSMDPMTKQQMEELQKRLSTPEGQKQLQEQLREMAKEDPSGDAEREKGLDDAERGGAEAEQGLGGMPMPMPGGPQQGPGDNGKQPGSDKGKGNDGKQAGGTGSHKDKGKGDHKGQTPSLKGNELRSKANAKVNPGVPLDGTTLGRSAARPGETANRAGTGSLGQVAPGEMSGVERSDVPEEYREQVGRYFQP